MCAVMVAEEREEEGKREGTGLGLYAFRGRGRGVRWWESLIHQNSKFLRSKKLRKVRTSDGITSSPNLDHLIMNRVVTLLQVTRLEVSHVQ